MHRLLAFATITLLVVGSLPIAAQEQATTGGARMAAARTVGKRASSPVLPGTRSDIFATIQGNALDSSNGPLIDAVVRLRDARFGHIVDTQLTDKSGLFVFKMVDRGTYVVELMGDDFQNILAASRMLNVNAGEAVSAVVKLPFRSNSTPRAAAVLAEAAATGIAAMVPTEPISPGS